MRVVLGRFVESGCDDFAVDVATHVGHFFRAFVDQKHKELDFGMVLGDGSCDILQQDRFSGARRGEQNAALAFADGREEVHDAGGVVVLLPFQIQFLIRMNRGQVFEGDAVLCLGGIFAIDRIDAGESEVAFVVAGLADKARDGIAGLELKTANLVRADVNVVRPGKVIQVGVAEESVTFLHDFESAFGIDGSAFAGGSGEQPVNESLLFQPFHVGDIQGVRLFLQIEHRRVAQFSPALHGKGDFFRIGGRSLQLVVGDVVLGKEPVVPTELVPTELVEFAVAVIAKSVVAVAIVLNVAVGVAAAVLGGSVERGVRHGRIERRIVLRCAGIGNAVGHVSYGVERTLVFFGEFACSRSGGDDGFVGKFGSRSGNEFGIRRMNWSRFAQSVFVGLFGLICGFDFRRQLFPWTSTVPFGWSFRFVFGQIFGKSDGGGEIA